MKNTLVLSRAMHKQIDLAIDALMEKENSRRTDELHHQKCLDVDSIECASFDVHFSYELGKLKSVEFTSFNFLKNF